MNSLRDALTRAEKQIPEANKRKLKRRHVNHRAFGHLEKLNDLSILQSRNVRVKAMKNSKKKKKRKNRDAGRNYIQGNGRGVRTKEDKRKVRTKEDKRKVRTKEDTIKTE